MFETCENMGEQGNTKILHPVSPPKWKIMGYTIVVSHFIPCINPLFLKLIVAIVALGLIPFH
jgi:hypothetical protein